MSRAEIPELEDWMSLPVAAETLGVARQRIFQMVDEKKLKTVRRIPGAGSRPAAYVVKKLEVEHLLAAQVAADSGVPEPVAVG